MRRPWFNVVALVTAIGAISVFSARRIEAQFSSPVKIVNTTSAPAITSRMDDHGRIPYQSEVDGGSAGIPPISCDQLIGCGFTFGPVPIGHRLVIERVSGVIPTTVAGQAFVSLLNPNPSSQIGNIYSAFTVPTTGTLGYFDEPTLVYIDSQQSVTVNVALSAGAAFPTGFIRRMIVKGYLLDCTAAPCAAIAN